MVCLACGQASGDYRRDFRSPFPARASTAGKRRGDIVQRSHEVNLLLTRQSVEPPP
jgi:hypothetical protein